MDVLPKPRPRAKHKIWKSFERLPYDDNYKWCRVSCRVCGKGLAASVPIMRAHKMKCEQRTVRDFEAEEVILVSDDDTESGNPRKRRAAAMKCEKINTQIIADVDKRIKESVDVCQTNEPLDLTATEITIKQEKIETKNNYEAMDIIGQENEDHNIIEDYKIPIEDFVKVEHDPILTNTDYSNSENDMIPIEEIVKTEHDPLSTDIEYSNSEDDKVTSIATPTNNVPVDSEREHGVGVITVEDKHVSEQEENKHKQVIATTSRNDRVEEDKVNNEKSENSSIEDNNDDSAFQNDKIDKYLKMWKVLYLKVDVQEQRNIYQEHKGSIRQAMDKMRLLNEERTTKNSRVCKSCQIDPTDNDELVNTGNRRRKISKCKRKKVIKYDCEECCTWLVGGHKPNKDIRPKRKTIDQFIQEWKILYPLVDVEEQVHIYVDNNSNFEQTVSKLKYLNDERKNKISVELDCKIKGLKDTRKEECSTLPKVVPSMSSIKAEKCPNTRVIIKTSKRGQPMALYKGFRLMVAKKHATFTWYRCCIRRCKARIKISNKAPYRILATSKNTHNHLPGYRCPVTEIAVQTT